MRLGRRSYLHSSTQRRIRLTTSTLPFTMGSPCLSAPERWIASSGIAELLPDRILVTATSAGCSFLITTPPTRLFLLSGREGTVGCRCSRVLVESKVPRKYSKKLKLNAKLRRHSCLQHQSMFQTRVRLI